MTPPTPPAPAPTLLAEEDWTARRARHRADVEALLDGHLRRRAAGEKHPVHDFLFTYYKHRPTQLRRWHPGYGVVLVGDTARDQLRQPGYERVEVNGAVGVTVSPATLSQRLGTVEFVASLLAATAARPAQLGCFGLHEWAMVYRTDGTGVRHSSVPLRLGHAGTDAVVESLQLRCSHYDAFRFFTPDAVPRNAEPLTRDDQLAREQPGCLHAGMDLYKWCFKLSPLVESELLLRCFRHAAAARELDMRASPYDLSDYGYSPITIETAAGRAQYVREQSALTTRAAALRQELLNRCTALRACRTDTSLATGG
ncbi:3-methyladenine DNA glycosylase [Rhodococcus chondri]|uniref:3-methyladenine DNA glycosylase n=1 Tax=Rhodococcus chondri TaxID=3065941 RepID=A0ABU7JWG6_9NOCA|nr:3-methyladenine DNA glycosylase [Rhodococcus sp. CC-R104]MEE2034370.1 3-methyladenine DNA glycosylase [Rhodococcus sp. CC-R104]